MATLVRRLRTSVAPMIDVTDPYFLRLTRLISPFGNHQLWTEMIHANAFSRGRIHLDPVKLAQNLPLRELEDFADNVVVQIGSSSPQDAHEAVDTLVKLGVRNINLNCGCPSRNVQMGAFGAVLMKTPNVVADIVSAMSEAARGSGCRISVKCRIGIDEDESPEFLHGFLSTVTGQTRHKDELPIDIVLHARRAWLNGLSPKQNRLVPVLNYERAYEMVRSFTNTSFIVNGGIDSVDSVVEHLKLADSVMIGRKVREDPWFLSHLDQHVYNVPEHMVPTPESVLAQYTQFADASHNTYGTRYSVLARPLFVFFRGRMGKAMRTHLGWTLTKAKSQNFSHKNATYSVQFGELVQEAVHAANAEYAARTRAPDAQVAEVGA
ncbi:hypothetical protein J3B01_000064 [Coemansia erecta]|nr:hypothetical protein J3B01_000064 [Coemansia erecta]